MHSVVLAELDYSVIGDPGLADGPGLSRNGPSALERNFPGFNWKQYITIL
jgi:hypothetical protein